MRWGAAAGWLLSSLLAAALAGCRAQANAPDDLGVDASADLAIPDLGSDLSSGDGGCPSGPEICNNGCDDDGNGYIDQDDPACSTQFLATTASGTATLDRLMLEPMPHVLALDGNSVPASAFAELNGGFSGDAYWVKDGAPPGELRTIMLSPTTGTGMVTMLQTSYVTRDVCVFNHQLIVVERGVPSMLHRFSDGNTEITPAISLGNVLATACASDGQNLFVAVHDQAGNPSQFLVFDQSLMQKGSIALPTTLITAGLDRCIDFAWSKRAGFYGLFVDSFNYSQPLNDDAMSATQLYPFAFDGAVGDPVDAGTIHGLGEFVP